MNLKGKNLSYEAQEPSFLRKLREQQQGIDTDRHERQIARPKRTKVDDEEDEPTYVVEESNHTISKAEYDAMIAGKENGSAEVHELDADGTVGDSATPKKAGTEDTNAVIEAGKVQKKRKAVKIVGMEQGEGEDETAPAPKKAAKPKRKAKAMALSFDDDEGKA